MLSKAKIKWIHSLEMKKFRNEYGLFLAEGHKLVGDLLPLLTCRFLAATPKWLAQHPATKADEICEVSDEELRRASIQQHPQEVLAVFEIPQHQLSIDELNKSLSLALDGVQDPGNLGTIIRIADWFGIENVICSKDTVDAYNPKTIQASMGAIGRVKVHYCLLPELFKQVQVPIFGTFLEGENIYRKTLPAQGIIVMGNEGKGVSKEVAALVDEKLFIPNFPPERQGSESLNVSTATAIVCSEFRRRIQ
ncbi:MAG: RNA methyltransferase [Bacteroidales bacterium]|nr:RNA methyltransferase [Bacteroidales bacterium]